jgi:antitoxin component YwqK of YwqJK toxin-antitoxin module
MDKLATLILVIFSLYSCKKKASKIEQTSVEIPESIVVLADTNLSERQRVLFYAQKPFSGFVIESYPNEKLASKNGYLNGELEGKQEKWYSNGSKMEIRFYHDNRKVGKHTGWWENKQMKFEYFIENDIPVKTHREWYPNGQLFSLSNYDNEGQPEGKQQMWFETGQIKANYIIKGGRRFGFLGAKGCMGENEKKQTGLNFKKNL